jgi:asparagine synthase (glutamine-hydrolysing)
MCGFAVAIDWPEAESTVAQLIQGILHRGDVSDPILAPRPTIAIGTRRLRIVDAAHGTQPQLSFNSGLAVSFNGEIYNHVAVRQELERRGHVRHLRALRQADRIRAP